MFTDDRAPGWSIDGGSDYFKYSVPKGCSLQRDTESLVLTSESTLDDILNKACWGTRGKSGDEPLKYILIKDMDLEHLQGVLTYINQPLSRRRRVLPYIKKALRYWHFSKRNTKVSTS